MKPIHILLILASVAALSVAVPVPDLDGEQVSLEYLSSIHGAKTDQSTVFDSTSTQSSDLPAPLYSDPDVKTVNVQADSQVSNDQSMISVRGWWFKVVDFKGIAGSENIMNACKAHGMEAPCGHNSYINHGGGCVAVPGMDGHWSIQSHVQSWGNSQALTNMFNHKYIFVGITSHKQYSHYNTAGSHEGAGPGTGRNPDGGQTVCIKRRITPLGKVLEVKGLYFATVPFSGVAGSENIMLACQTHGMEALCGHNSYVNHGGGCMTVSGFDGYHWSIQSHVQAWGQNQELTNMFNYKYIFVGINSHKQYSHYNTAGSHEGAGAGQGRNPDGGETVCASRNPPGPSCEVSAFGPWSPCSKSCGGGKQTRTRTVTKDGSQCPALSEQQTCHAQECHTNTTDIGKTMLGTLQSNLQKLTTTNNNLKADSDRTAAAAASAKTLFEEASSDMATKKANMENAMTASEAAVKKCKDNTEEHLSAQAAQAQAASNDTFCSH